MKEQRTFKVADIQTGRGFDLVVILDKKAKTFPLKVYKSYYSNGYHKIKINEFGDMVTAMRYMTHIISGGITV